MTVSRTLTVAAVALALPALAAPTAQAGSQLTKNSCFWSIDDVHRDLDITTTGVATPNPVGPGGTVTLGQTSASSRLPDDIAENGYDLGLLKKGDNDIPATIWMALRSDTTPAETRVVSATVTARTTITTDAQEYFVSATPMNVTVPMADTTWTAPGAGQTLRLAQADGGTLPPLPIGPGGATRQPRGSIVIQAALSNATRLTLDCQPGASTTGGAGITPAAASPFESVAVPAAGQPTPPPLLAPPTPVAPAPAPKPVIRGGLVKASRNRLVAPLSLGCTALPGACFGRVELRSVARQRVGSAAPRMVTLARGTYSVPSGGRRTLRIQLTDTGRALLRRKPGLTARLRLFSQDSTTPGVATVSSIVAFRR